MFELVNIPFWMVYTYRSLFVLQEYATALMILTSAIQIIF